MTGTKRKSSGSDPNTRPPKVARTAVLKSTKKAHKKGPRKRGTKPSISAEMFNSTASPLHVSLTHIPPTNVDSQTEHASVDSGLIGSVTLAPSTFSTGSFGWKGSKRMTVELPSSKGDEKEKVQVMLTINATVVGSKPPQTDETNDAAEEEESNNESKLEGSSFRL